MLNISKANTENNNIFITNHAHKMEFKKFLINNYKDYTKD